MYRYFYPATTYLCSTHVCADINAHAHHATSAATTAVARLSGLSRVSLLVLAAARLLCVGSRTPTKNNTIAMKTIYPNQWDEGGASAGGVDEKRLCKRFSNVQQLQQRELLGLRPMCVWVLVCLCTCVRRTRMHIMYACTVHDILWKNLCEFVPTPCTKNKRHGW